jgi:hypothetical protein
MTEEQRQDPPESQEAQREAPDSQQEPQQDSGLQTPQPDQRMPTETERGQSQEQGPEPPAAPTQDQASDS